MDGVRLHYLDWGGSGEVVLLLHGLGASAHIFDDLAPRLTDRFRVLALTRRGHAESDHPESGYSIAETTADVLAFLDTLGIRSAHLIGHSLGGAEATRLAVDHPERVHRLVYLDALPDWTEVESLFGRGEPERPPPGDAFRTIDTHREWLHHKFYGFWTPALEADFRYARPNPTAISALREDAFALPLEYNRLRVPVLAISAVPTMATSFAWLRHPGIDPREHDRAREHLDQVLIPYEAARVERFRHGVPHGEVLELRGSHHIHNSKPEEVVTAIRAFLLADD